LGAVDDAHAARGPLLQASHGARSLRHREDQRLKRRLRPAIVVGATEGHRAVLAEGSSHLLEDGPIVVDAPGRELAFARDAEKRVHAANPLRTNAAATAMSSGRSTSTVFATGALHRA